MISSLLIGVSPLSDELRALWPHHQILMAAEKPDLDVIYLSLEMHGEIETVLAKIRAKSHSEMMSYVTEVQKLEMQDRKAMRKKDRRYHRSDQLMNDKI